MCHGRDGEGTLFLFRAVIKFARERERGSDIDFSMLSAGLGFSGNKTTFFVMRLERCLFFLCINKCFCRL